MTAFVQQLSLVVIFILNVEQFVCTAQQQYFLRSQQYQDEQRGKQPSTTLFSNFQNLFKLNKTNNEYQSGKRTVDCCKRLSLAETHENLPEIHARQRREIANNMIVDLKQRSSPHRAYPSYPRKRRVVDATDYSSNDPRYRHPLRRHQRAHRTISTQPSPLPLYERSRNGDVLSMNPKLSFREYARMYHELHPKATIARKAIGKKFRYGKMKQHSWPTTSFVHASSPYVILGSREYAPYDEPTIDLKTGEEDLDYLRMMENDKSVLNNLNSFTETIEQQPSALFQQPTYISAATAAAAPSYVQLASQSFPLADYYSPSQITSNTVSRNAIPLDIPYSSVQRAPTTILAAPIYDDYGSAANLNNVFGALQCFSGDMTVETPEGTKAIRTLRIGDNVLSIDGSLITYSPVIMFLHRIDNEIAEFNLLTMEDNRHIKLTDFHLIYVSNCGINEQFRLVHSKDILEGQCLHAIHTNDDNNHDSIKNNNNDNIYNAVNTYNSMKQLKVINVTRVVDSGIYAPLTTTGKIFINSVLSSCHSNVMLETLQQTFFTQIKRFNSWFGEWWTSTEHNKCHSSSKCDEDDEQLHREYLPLGVEYLTTILDLIVPHETFMR